MSVITIFSGVFCNDKAVIQDVVESTGCRLITDDMIAESASVLSGISKSKIETAFSFKTSVFNQFTHEKEQSIAYMKLAVSRILDDENLIFSGYAGLLIPQTIQHVLRVCLIAKTTFRTLLAKQQQQLSSEDAGQIILRADQDRSAWTKLLFSNSDPWDPSLFDIVLPMGKTERYKVSALIGENLLKEAVRQTEGSKQAVNDFQLSANTEVALLNAGHNVKVTAQKGAVLLTIDKQVLMLNRLENDLKAITQKIPGVIDVAVRIAPNNRVSNIYRKHNLDFPSKVLLVDDEREFVQTLSERLQLRDVGSAVVYDGKSAMDIVKNDDPEVMIIDLKMPGMDGMEILTQVKQIRPKIEVIVLTGHGSEQDKDQCMNLGAFAYMQKPVDINLLSQTLKEAHKQFKSNK